MEESSSENEILDKDNDDGVDQCSITTQDTAVFVSDLNVKLTEEEIDQMI